MQDRNISFMALGGAQSIGSSCYYLQLGNSNILLDCGASGILFPDFYPLITSKLESMGQISSIFISHAHMDHIGGLLQVAKMCPRAQIYMTKATLLMAKIQLDKKTVKPQDGESRKELEIQAVLDRVTVVNYMEKKDFGTYTAEFYPAGHIPGAMMVLFTFAGKHILYTGDYSTEKTTLTDGCVFPENIDVDDMIMCAIHARQPDYSHWKNSVSNQIHNVLYEAEHGRVVVCKTPQLSKGVELLKMMNEANELRSVDIYVSDSVMLMVQLMEQLACPVLTPFNKPLDYFNPFSNEGCVILTSTELSYPGFDFTNVKMDFSLHDDFGQMKDFITAINPKELLIVHTSPPVYSDEYTIEQIMLMEGNVRTSFTFPEEGQMYIL